MIDPIRVQINGEWGVFLLEEWTRPNDRNGTTHGCMLVAHTTFGTVGHTWISMGAPAVQFFERTNADYILGKLWGERAEVFDLDTAKRNIKKQLIEERRQRELSAVSTRELWCDIEELEADSSGALWAEIGHIPYLYRMLADAGPRAEIRNPQAAGFWLHLWPLFIEQLKERAK